MQYYILILKLKILLRLSQHCSSLSLFTFQSLCFPCSGFYCIHSPSLLWIVLSAFSILILLCPEKLYCIYDFPYPPIKWKPKPTLLHRLISSTNCHCFHVYML